MMKTCTQLQLTVMTHSMQQKPRAPRDWPAKLKEALHLMRMSARSAVRLILMTRAATRRTSTLYWNHTF